ncbi:MAG TPA: hypothetical protein VMT00_09085 [Thermoanaerobaculia bacterium]|nr:hypothetical protein [Thermoanaerobaculia bacterium]
MKCIQVAVLAIAQASVVLAAVTSAGDPLWNRAVAIAARSQLLPRAAIVTTTLATRGLPDRNIETRVTFRSDRDGQLESTIVFRREGKRILDAEDRRRRNDIDTRRRRAAPFRIDELPMSPLMQPFVTYRRVGSSDENIRFEFTIRRGDHAMVGAVTLAGDGQPLSIEFEPRPLPAGVRSMHTLVRLSPTPDGGCRLESMTVRGTAGPGWLNHSFRSHYGFTSEDEAKEQ